MAVETTVKTKSIIMSNMASSIRSGRGQVWIKDSYKRIAVTFLSPLLLRATNFSHSTL